MNYETQTAVPIVKSDRSRVVVDGKTVLNYVPVAELPGRCARAANLACGDRNVYSDENRQDCAAHLVLAVLAELDRQTVRRPMMDRVQVVRATDTSAVRDLLSWMDRAERDYRQSFPVPAIPPKLCTGARLFGMASNWRRSEDARRDRDAAATVADGTTRIITEDPETLGTAQGARKRALTVCDALGLRPLRKGDAPIFTTVYAACRATAGLESDRIAAELFLTPATYRQHLVRGPKRIPATGALPMASFYDALDCADVGFTRPTGLPESAFRRIRVGEKGDLFPNVSTRTRTVHGTATLDVTVTGKTGARTVRWTVPTGYDYSVQRGANGRSVGAIETAQTRATRTAWDRLPVGRRKVAAWATVLPARAHTVYGSQAMRQRARATAKSDAQRHADRTAAGIRSAVL